LLNEIISCKAGYPYPWIEIVADETYVKRFLPARVDRSRVNHELKATIIETLTASAKGVYVHNAPTTDDRFLVAATRQPSLHGHIEIVDLLLSRNRNPSPRTISGVIPLYLSAERGHICR
jgi:hypothetical protein